MKKAKLISIALLLVLAVIGSIIGSGFATNSTENIQITTGIGAKVRLLQLQTSLDTNIEVGNLILAKLNANSTNTTNTTALVQAQVALDNLVEVRERLDVAINTTYASVEEAASVFIDLKQDAMQYTADFRVAISSQVTSEVKTELRDDMREIKENQRESRKDQLRAYIREHNALIISATVNASGLKFGQLDADVRAGRMDAHQALISMRKEFFDLSVSARADVLARISEHQVRTEIAMQKIEQRMQERMQERMDYDSEYNARVNARIDSDVEIDGPLGIKARMRERMAYENSDDNADSNAEDDSSVNASVEVSLS